MGFPPQGSGTVDVSAPRVKRVGMTASGQAQYTSIQAAINAAAADATPPSASAPYVIEIYPGVYNEVITMADYVYLKGIGPSGAVVIYQADADVVTLAAHSQIENVTLRITTPTTSRNFIKDNTVVCIARIVRVVLESTTPGANQLRCFLISAASNLIIENCSHSLAGTGASKTIFTTGAAIIRLINNDFSFANANANHFQGNLATIYGSGNRWGGTAALVSSFTSGSITLDGDRIVCTGTSIVAAAASCVVKSAPQQYEVYAGMKIQHAITAAAADTPAPSATAPYTILIHPGVYTEAVTCSTYVNLKGIGPKGAVVIQQTDATIVTLATQVQIENFTLRIVTPTTTRSWIIDNGVAVIAQITDIIFECIIPGANNCRLMVFSAASTIIAKGCFADIATTAAGEFFRNSGGATKITLIDCNISFPNSVTTGAILQPGYLLTIINVFRCDFYSPGRLISCSTTATVIIANSRINCGYPSSMSSGILRFNNCQYRPTEVVRSSTGNIVDESSCILDTIYHVAQYSGEVKIANANIATRASGGTVTDGGTGQSVLECTAAAQYIGIENPADAAGGLATSFNPARTPRFVCQFSATAFSANCTMFFGLRATLGNAVPAAAENHAGFIWNGTNFKAVNADGTTQKADNCSTPSAGVQHQLEVIILGGVQVEFYIDGILVFTHTTNLPTGEMNWQVLQTNNAAQTVDLSVRKMFVQECPA